VLKAIEEISATKKDKIEIPAEIVEGELQKALKEIQKKAKIPGFRPGKTPLSIIEKNLAKMLNLMFLKGLFQNPIIKRLKRQN